MSGPDKAVSPARQTATLLVMCLAVVAVIANVTALNVGVPVIGRALRADQSQLQWMVDAYALLLAAFLLPAGALGDRFSRKGTLLVGLAIMGAGAVWSATAHTALVLILARGAAGIGAAFVFPSTLSTLTAISTGERKGRAVAIWSACTALGGTVGLVGSGALLQHHPWPWIFWASGGLAGVTFVLAALIAVDTRDPEHAHLDPVGTLLSVIGVGGLVLGITEGPVRGWTDRLTLVGLVAGAVGIIAFIVWEAYTDRPLLDVRLFKQAQLGMSALAVLILFLATFGAFFLCVQYTAYMFGYGPMKSGLAILPMAATLVPMSNLGIVIARRLSVFPVQAAGLAIGGAGFVYMTTLWARSTYWNFATGLLIFGAGVGLCMAPATEAIVSALPSAKQGVASAVNDTGRELGGALGIAIVGSLFNIGYRSAVDHSLVIPAKLIPVVRTSPAQGLSVATSPNMVADVRDAFIHGWWLSLWAAAGIFAFGTVVMTAVAIHQRGRRPYFADEPIDAPAAPAPYAGATFLSDAPRFETAPGDDWFTLATSVPPPPPSALLPTGSDGVQTLIARVETTLAELRNASAQRELELAELRVIADRVQSSGDRAAEVLERAAAELVKLADGLRNGPASR
jgi:EmrB/QacA subfamily drug resistance transporter